MEITINDDIINAQVETLANARIDAMAEEISRTAVNRFIDKIIRQAGSAMLRDCGDPDELTDDEFNEVVSDIIMREELNSFDPADALGNWLTNGCFEPIFKGKYEEIVNRRVRWYEIDVSETLTSTIRVKAKSEEDAREYAEDIDADSVDWDSDGIEIGEIYESSNQRDTTYNSFDATEDD